jgi:hypothetical protein
VYIILFPLLRGVIPVLIFGGLAGSLRILSDYICLCIFEPLVLIFIATFLALLTALTAFYIRALAIMLMRRVHLMMGLFATPLLLMRGHALLDHE